MRRTPPGRSTRTVHGDTERLSQRQPSLLLRPRRAGGGTYSRKPLSPEPLTRRSASRWTPSPPGFNADPDGAAFVAAHHLAFDEGAPPQHLVSPKLRGRQHLGAGPLLRPGRDRTQRWLNSPCQRARRRCPFALATQAVPRDDAHETPHALAPLRRPLLAGFSAFRQVQTSGKLPTLATRRIPSWRTSSSPTPRPLPKRGK